MVSVYCNHNRNTCIAYEEDDGLVRAVAMQSPELGLLEMGSEQFHRQWTLLETDVKAAASKYLSGYIPFSIEVKSILEKIVMGTKKAAAATTATEAKEPAGKKAAAAKKKTEDFFKDAEKKVEATKQAAAPAAAEPKGKGKGKAAAEPAAPKKEKATKAPRAPKEDLTNKKITLLPLPEGKRFQSGSVRADCYAKIKDGMTVKAYLAATGKANVEEKVAIDCLKKLALATQKYPTIKLVD